MAHSLIPKKWGEDKGGDVFSNLHRQIDRVFDDFTHGEHWPFAALSPERTECSGLPPVPALPCW